MPKINDVVLVGWLCKKCNTPFWIEESLRIKLPKVCPCCGEALTPGCRTKYSVTLAGKFQYKIENVEDSRLNQKPLIKE